MGTGLLIANMIGDMRQIYYDKIQVSIYLSDDVTDALAAGWAWEAAGPGLAFTVSSAAAAAGLLFAYPLKRKGL